MIADDLKHMDILDLADNKWVTHQLNGDIVTIGGFLSQKVDGTLFVTGGNALSSCVFKIDPNMIVTQMVPMLKSRSFVKPVLVQDRYILVIGGHSDPSQLKKNLSMVDCECFDTIKNTWT